MADKQVAREDSCDQPPKGTCTLYRSSAEVQKCVIASISKIVRLFQGVPLSYPKKLHSLQRMGFVLTESFFFSGAQREKRYVGRSESLLR